jgi:single-stranded DNA-binding protein
MKRKFESLSDDELRQASMKRKTSFKQHLLQHEAFIRIYYWRGLAENLEEILLGARGKE